MHEEDFHLSDQVHFQAHERTLPACKFYRVPRSNLNGNGYSEYEHARCVRSQAKSVSSKRRLQDAYKVQAVSGILQMVFKMTHRHRSM